PAPRAASISAEEIIAGPSVVTTEKGPDGSYQYLVDGVPQVFIGMGYNPIYRYLSDAERAANYDRDFRILCQAGVNTITGWDADKGYEQDKFDELTLDYASRYGLGVVMPFYLPPDGDYQDPAFTEELLELAAAKIVRFMHHPALRMWGVGNEVLTEMPQQMWPAFGEFYLQLADLFHVLDANHPVIYREAEDIYLAELTEMLELDTQQRPWLLYGTNVYSERIDAILADWPSHGFDIPLIVSEFGAYPYWTGGRAEGYVRMWQTIRSYPDYVLGGAPYVWMTDGPEPTDQLWGLMNDNAQAVDDTFPRLSEEWLAENGEVSLCYQER
ncbi:MAG: hypothetical protein EPO21_08980, partial [Chloroflexota bacterium]